MFSDILSTMDLEGMILLYVPEEYLAYFEGNENLTALGVFIFFFISLFLIKFLIVSQLNRVFKKTKYHWDDAFIGAFHSLLKPITIIIISLYASVQFLEVLDFLEKVLNVSMLAYLTFVFIRSCEPLLKQTVVVVLTKTSFTKNENDEAIVTLVYNVLRAALWVVAILIIIQNLGFNVSAILGGLGIAGIAIAFGLQSVLEDIFAYFTIYLDSPFKKGDYIVVGTDSGVIEHIGIKSTRLKTLQGEELIISNRELTTVRLNNFKKMEERRVTFTFGVTYDTSSAKLKKIPSIVKRVITEQKYASIDRVALTEFADSSLIFEVVYFMEVSDIKKYKSTHQKILLGLKNEFEKESIEFAYPTQTLYVENIKKT
jgi:small-conductance mechanosensitive channel